MVKIGLRGRQITDLLPKGRARILLVLSLLGFLILLLRGLYLQGLHNDFLRQKGDARYSRVIAISGTRGMITDRLGEPLAISTPVESVWASRPDVEMTQPQLVKLAKLLELNPSDIEKRLEESKREFVYLRRQLPPAVAAQIVQLDIPGVFLQREYRRYYPAAEVTAHLLGFTDVEDRGQEGLELAYNSWLAGKTGSRRVIKDRLGHIIEDVESVHTPQQGHNLTLSIDRKIQYLAYRELKAAVQANKAKAGAIVALDAKTGEVLALANVPSYNPNNRVQLAAGRTRNRVVTDVFEPGSTMKPFIAAAALENGSFEADTKIQTSPGFIYIGGKTIHDAHPQGVLTLAQVIQKSSNVGVTKVALTMPAEHMWKMFSSLGFGASTNSGFPGEGTGRLRAFKNWRPIEQATMSFGHGISVTLLQLARAYTVFANDGELKPISLVKLNAPAAGTQAFSPATIKEVKNMLESVVQPGGTALRAQVVGYRVAGKTGTSHKLEGGGYVKDRYVSSFVGMAPASNPRLIIAVMIDDPTAGQYYGGAVAAPVFATVMAGALRMLSIPPDAPTQNIVIPTEIEPEAPGIT